jgi:hypothetical protein
LTRGANIRGFLFYLEVAKKNRSDIGKIFCFRLILGFEMIFQVFEAIDGLIMLPIMF